MPYPHLSAPEITIKCITKLMKPIVSWLIKAGIGYKDFSPILKRIFFEQSLIEAQKNMHKTTDSSLSLLAGLNRRDVIYFKETPLISDQPTNTISISSRVITLWRQKNWPNKIKFSNSEISFVALSKTISKDTHPKTVLLDLQRLELVSIVGDTVILNAHSFTPSQSLIKCQVLLADSVADHLEAGFSNIFIKSNQYLEQSVNVNELTEESVRELKNYSIQLWQDSSSKLLDKSMELSIKDKNQVGADKRFSFGSYQYDDLEINE